MREANLGLFKDNPSISTELLEEYTGGEREFIIELTEQFWIDIEARLPQLEAAVTTFNPEIVASIAHSIAGSASCLGAQPLSKKALALQECGRQKRGEAAESLLLELKEELKAVKAFFLDYLGQ